MIYYYVYLFSSYKYEIKFIKFFVDFWHYYKILINILTTYCVVVFEKRHYKTHKQKLKCKNLQEIILYKSLSLFFSLFLSPPLLFQYSNKSKNLKKLLKLNKISQKSFSK